MTSSWGCGTASTAGWRMGVRIATDDSRLRVMARMLAAEFGRFDFGICETSSHVSIAAVRNDRDAPGVHVVITNDLGEMRRVLLEDESSPPGRRGGNAPGGNAPGGG